ncbi:Predicted nucleic acid-binding protein, contains Zn-ribbon domain [Caloramator quimbayensis]|uniref:Predicted nucleic acid-binding protein, contains Zn-ribbon domain n=1 Tax=Caloramator quimbayensis TaxID=1147123 RepID=A0A1T4XAE7_9CLOT|nr:C4-type zinc ribbon domain-containing protein [Caloramator quimbayensis]SKA86068.1 Predicted nucleic acid-binding protein, contains Zn-ribbon domain [Caloramator quimbayensis]
MDIDLLFEISKIDDEIKSLEKNKNIKDMAIKIRKYREDYEKYKKEYDEISRDIKEIEDSINDITKDIESINSDIKIIENKLYSTSNLKTIDVWQKSLEQKKYEVCKKEEEVYNILERLDKIKKDKENILNKAKELKDSYNFLREEYIKATNEINIRVKELNEKRELLMKEIDDLIVEEYEKIKNVKGYGMRALKDEICSGCGIDVPTVIISEARNKRKITKCPHCGVILYVID